MFRKLEPLGTDTKNMDCSRLVTMLHLEIKKGEDDMKTSDVQKYLKETAFCMKRLKTDTKGCDKLTSNETNFSDSWFSGVKKYKGAVSAGVNYCGPVKTSNKGLCLATL